MGDIDGRDTNLVVHLGEEASRFDTQLGVKVRQRLVHEKDAGAAHKRASKRDALSLSARKSLRQPVKQRVDPQPIGHAANLRVDFASSLAPDPHAEGDVLEHGHMRKQRVGLEDHRNVAGFRRHVGHVAAANQQLTGRNGLEPRDHVEGRRLAASGRANEHHKRAVRDFKIELRDDDMRAKTLLDVDEGNVGHEPRLSCRLNPSPSRQNSRWKSIDRQK